MEMKSAADQSFKTYGRLIEGYNTKEVVEILNSIELPKEGTAYRPSDRQLEASALYPVLKSNAFGGIDIQFGTCCGHNTHLNCLEYHMGNEIVIPSEDIVLLMAKLDEVENYALDTSKIKAFFLEKGRVLEIYSTTLHYAPCCPGKGFRVAVALPFGTNREKPEITALNKEDKLLWAKNNWLLAHKDSWEGQHGAHIGLIGENIEISSF